MLHPPDAPFIIGILCLVAASFRIAGQIIERTRPDRDLATGDDCRPSDLLSDREP